MAVGLTVLKIGRGRRSEGSRHIEMDYNSLKMQFRTIETANCSVELECIPKWPSLAEVCDLRALNLVYGKRIYWAVPVVFVDSPCTDPGYRPPRFCGIRHC